MALDPNLGTPASDTDPTAGGSPGGNADPGASAGSQGTPTATPPTPASDRAFTQADVDRIVQERLARDRRERQPSPAYTPTSPTPAPTPNQPSGEIPQWAQPILRSHAINDVRWTVSQMREQHKDFAANETAIVELAAQIAEENPGVAPAAALNFALYRFRADAYSKIDLEAERKKARDEAIAEYSGAKKDKSEKTPKSEGPGGSAPATTRKITTRKDFEAALEEGLARVEM